MESIIKFFQDGGFFMYPIACVLAVGVAISIERFVYLRRAARANKESLNIVLLPLLRQGNFMAAADKARAASTAIASMIDIGLTRFNSGRSRDEIEFAMEESLMEVLPRLEKRTPYLAMLANVATLLGLLGTIIGLIAAFTAVANADPAEKANLLSQSISVAMNTTAFGLMAAIPLLLLHSILQAKTNELIDTFEMAGIKVLNLCASAKA